MGWEGEDTAPNLFQPPKTKAKRAPTPVPKETLIKERYSAVSGVRVCLYAFHGILRSVSRVISACTQVDSCVQRR